MSSGLTTSPFFAGAFHRSISTSGVSDGTTGVWNWCFQKWTGIPYRLCWSRSWTVSPCTVWFHHRYTRPKSPSSDWTSQPAGFFRDQSGWRDQPEIRYEPYAWTWSADHSRQIYQRRYYAYLLFRRPPSGSPYHKVEVAERRGPGPCRKSTTNRIFGEGITSLLCILFQAQRSRTQNIFLRAVLWLVTAQFPPLRLPFRLPDT